MEDSQNLLTIIEFTDTVTESFPIEDYILEVDPVDLITEDDYVSRQILMLH